MDEILASIRQLIADDSTNARPAAEKRPVFPRLDTSEFRPRAPDLSGDGRLLPPADRFSSSIKPPATPVPAPPIPSAPTVSPPVPRAPLANVSVTAPAKSTEAINFGLDDLLDDDPMAEAVASIPSEPVPDPIAKPAGEIDFKPQFESASRLEAETVIASKVAEGSNQDPWAAWRSLRLNSQSTEPDARPAVPAAAGVPQKRGFYPPPAAIKKAAAPPSFSNVFPRSDGGPSQAVGAPPIAKDAAQLPSSPAAAALSSQTLNGAGKQSPAPVKPALAPLSKAEPVDSGAEIVTAAVNDALDQLAAGLAAASPAAPVLAVSPANPPALVLAPTQATAPVNGTAAAPQQNPLEGMVADMLRPMLERWIESNMPRILQKALEDTGKKDGSKST